MKKTNENYTIEDDREIDVEIDYRCFFSPTQAYAPMTLYSSIYKGNDLENQVADGKTSYEKQYQKVEVMEVRIDI